MEIQYKTVHGLDAVVFFDRASNDYPLLGMYYNEKVEEWMPTRWDINGKVNSTLNSGLDLILPVTAEAA
jgi:hypothetical protein